MSRKDKMQNKGVGRRKGDNARMGGFPDQLMPTIHVLPVRRKKPKKVWKRDDAMFEREGDMADMRNRWKYWEKRKEKQRDTAKARLNCAG